MGLFFSVFGSADDTNDDSRGGGHGSNEVQEWCRLTRDYAERDDVHYTEEMCEAEMQKDVNKVMGQVDMFLVYLGPHDLAELEVAESDESYYNSLVLSSYDNASNMDTGDDPRWTIELGNRVRDLLRSQGRRISADQKVLLNSDIRRTSKLGHRSLYDYRGTSSHPHFGQIKTVYSFSGRA